MLKILEKRTKPEIKKTLSKDTSLYIEDCQVNSD